MASINDVMNFLTKVKRIINTDSDRFLLIQRKISMEAIERFGIIPRLEVLTLSYRDYDRGPLPDDRGDGGYVWEFIKDIDGNLIYIKLRIDERGCVCISIHEANGPFSLPYR